MVTGVTIRNGSGTTPNGPNSIGGGVYVQSGSLLLVNSHVVGNRVVGSAGGPPGARRHRHHGRQPHSAGQHGRRQHGNGARQPRRRHRRERPEPSWDQPAQLDRHGQRRRRRPGLTLRRRDLRRTQASVVAPDQRHDRGQFSSPGTGDAMAFAGAAQQPSAMSNTILAGPPQGARVRRVGFSGSRRTTTSSRTARAR